MNPIDLHVSLNFKRNKQSLYCSLNIEIQHEVLTLSFFLVTLVVVYNIMGFKS